MYPENQHNSSEPMKLFSLLLASAACAATPVLQGAPAAPASGSAQISSGLASQKVEGIDVVAYHTGVKEVVTIRGALAVGDVQASSTNLAAAKLTAMMLDKGTKSLDKFAITSKLEAVGAEIGFGAGDFVTEFSAKCLSKDLPLVLALLSDQLRNPAFAPEELAKLKKQVATGVKRRLESPDFRAADAFSRAIFPVGHPNRNPSSEDYLAAVEKLTVDDLKAFHAQYYGSKDMKLIAVGDVDPVQLQIEVAKSFSGWTTGAGLHSPERAPIAKAASEQVVQMAEKPSVSIVMGQATGLRYSDPDTLPLRVGTAILGSGFTGRLMSTVRDKEGLTYGIGAGVSGDTYVDGQWQISATFDPAVLEKGIASTRRELLKWRDEGVTVDELERRKSNLIGTYKVGLATTGGLAGQILITLQRGYPTSWLDEYPVRLQALTQPQVNEVIRRHIDPDSLVTVKAGSVPVAK